ncbi:MAG: hypothetical protein AAF550_08625 [Myxococcota bacterium]
MNRNAKGNGPFPGSQAAIWISISLGVHAIWVAWLTWNAPLEMHLGLEFELPIEIELGRTEEAQPWSPAPTNPASAERAAASGVQALGASARSQPDNPSKTGPPLGTTSSFETGANDPDAPAPKDASAIRPAKDDEKQRNPKGAQIALRLDMEVIRRSPIQAHVRRLLERSPDWDALLSGSGIDPVSELSRLMLASPNLQRARWMVLGSYRGDASYVRNAVARIAANRGTEVKWKRRFGVDTAPWVSKDPTPRVLSVLAPGYFSISRPQDLPRVIALAQSHAVRARDWGKQLLSMDAEEACSIEVYGLSRFLKALPSGGLSGAALPERGKMSIMLEQERGFAAKAEFHFSQERGAAEASAHIQNLLPRIATQPMLRLMGFSKIVEDLTVIQDRRTIRVETSIGVSQSALITSLLQNLLVDTSL